jgi:hypothetical protein
MGGGHTAQAPTNKASHVRSLSVLASAFIIHHSAFVIHHSSFVIHHSSFIIHHSPIHHSSFVIRDSWLPVL